MRIVSCSPPFVVSEQPIMYKPYELDLGGTFLGFWQEIKPFMDCGVDIERVCAKYLRKGPANAESPDGHKLSLRELTRAEDDEIREASGTRLWRASQMRIRTSPFVLTML